MERVVAFPIATGPQLPPWPPTVALQSGAGSTEGTLVLESALPDSAGLADGLRAETAQPAGAVSPNP